MTDFRKLVEEQVIAGQQAGGFMALPVVGDFFRHEVLRYVTELLELDDPIDVERVRRIVLDYRATRRLHDSLSAAVADGLTATRRLKEQAVETT